MNRAAIALLLLAGACQRPPSSQDGPTRRDAPAGNRPADIRTSAFEDPRIRESSGVAVSRRWPGLVWTHNDSGDGPFLYVTDTLGHGTTRLTVAGAENTDWEDLALGPCPAGTCLYIADTGNNAGSRPEFRILRVAEPVSAAAGNLLPGAALLRFGYPGGPENVEAMFVGPDTTVHLITKTRRGPIRHYRLSAEAWRSPGVTIAADLGPVPVAPDRGGGQLVTGAALAPDGRRVAIRTNDAVHFFQLRPDGVLEPDPVWPTCDITGVDVQGEAIAWLDTTRLLLTSERGWASTGRISLITCPHPDRAP